MANANVFNNTILQDNRHLAEGVGFLLAAFDSLLAGDIGGFLANIIGFAPVVGAFLIIYLLFSFITRVSIFKGPEHKRYANMFGIGMALIGILQQNVSNLIIDFLSGGVLQLMLSVLGVWLFIFFIKRMNKSHVEMSADTNRVRSGNYAAKLDSLKSRNAYTAAGGISAAAEAEKFAAKKLRRDTHKAEKSMESSLATEHKETKKAEKQAEKIEDEIKKESLHPIDELVNLLSRLNGIPADSKERGTIEKQIGKDFDKITNSFKEEFKDFSKLENEIIRLENLEVKSVNFGNAADHGVLKMDIHKYIDKLLRATIAAHAKDLNKSEIFKNMMVQNRDRFDQLKEAAVQLDVHRLDLSKKVSAYVKRIQQEYQGNILTLEQQINATISSGNIPSAINLLHKLKADLQKVIIADESVEKYLKDIDGYVRKRIELEDLFQKIIDDLTGPDMVKKISSGHFNAAIDKAKKVQNEEQQAAAKEKSETAQESNEANKAGSQGHQL